MRPRYRVLLKFVDISPDLPQFLSIGSNHTPNVFIPVVKEDNAEIVDKLRNVYNSRADYLSSITAIFITQEF